MKRPLVVACALAIATASATAARSDGTSPSAAASTSGPSGRPLARGAAPVESFEVLERLVADPAGPAEITVAGTLRGDLVIKRPLHLRGAPGAVLEGTGRGTVISVQATDVTVEDLVVRHSGRRHTTEDSAIKAAGERVAIRGVRVESSLFGISLAACKACLVERAHVIGGDDDDTELRGDGIKLWESHDSIVRKSRLERSRDLVVWYTRRALLEDNVVVKSRYGSHFMYAHDARVRRSRFEGNVVGVFVMYSSRVHVEGNVLAGARGAAGVGLGFKDSDAVEVRGNWLVANTTGSYLDNTPRSPAEPVTVAGNVLGLNDVALRLHSGSPGLHLVGNDFRDNATMVEVDGGGDALQVDVRGNRFSDYEGYDLDGDGVGDVPYEVKALSTQLTETKPSLKFFHGTAAMGLVDSVSRAVPVLASRRLLLDPAPRTTGFEVPIP